MLIESGPSGKHLFVVMTNVCEDGEHLLLNVSSIKPGKNHDTACVFNGGEHEFIKVPSFVQYRFAEFRRADQIAKFVGTGYFELKPDLDAPPFKKICAGIYTSLFIKPRVQTYFHENQP